MPDNESITRTSFSSLTAPESLARRRRASSVSIHSPSIASSPTSVEGGLACHLPTTSDTPSINAASSVSRRTKPLLIERCLAIRFKTASASGSSSPSSTSFAAEAEPRPLRRLASRPLIASTSDESTWSSSSRSVNASLEPRPGLRLALRWCAFVVRSFIASISSSSESLGIRAPLRAATRAPSTPSSSISSMLSCRTTLEPLPSSLGFPGGMAFRLSSTSASSPAATSASMSSLSGVSLMVALRCSPRLTSSTAAVISGSTSTPAPSSLSGAVLSCLLSPYIPYRRPVATDLSRCASAASTSSGL